ncbi:MAG: hypothetical protein A3F09_05035 [Chlamydiae bacterium RIFCSPHIGHO2_12_FULL_49_11]|nr:MAG: hypothetical protein A3F09_05035 [Chlamydiae bacterium RIFCSPHIGHO2_12_FULL_49_11]
MRILFSLVLAASLGIHASDSDRLYRLESATQKTLFLLQRFEQNENLNEYYIRYTDVIQKCRSLYLSLLTESPKCLHIVLSHDAPSLKEEAEKYLDQSIKEFLMGTTVTGFAVIELMRQDPLGAALLAKEGFEKFEASYRDFQEARRLQALNQHESPSIEHEFQNRASEPDVFDRRDY